MIRVSIHDSRDPYMSNVETGPLISKTTEIYTHVSSKDFMKIRNPLDQILERKEGSSGL